MSYRFAVLVLAVLACGTLASVSQADEPLPGGMAPPSVAQSLGITGKESAHDVGLSIDRIQIRK